MPLVTRALNCTYFLDDGTQLVDGLSGTYNLPLGHCSPEEISAIRLALGVVHNSYKEDDGSAQSLGVLLNTVLAVVDRHWKFMSTGSEAIERAVMCSVPAGGTLVVMEGAFHGKSYFTAKAHYNVGWAWPFEVVTIPWMDFDALPDRFDAILFEPVQGWTGRAATREELARLWYLSEASDAMIIADEVLCGLYRAGRPFYSYAADPDILVVAKGMAGALPIAAVGFRNLAHAARCTVGWTATHANNSLANRVAINLLGRTVEHGKFHAPEIEQRWRAAFPESDGHRITGSLIYVKATDATRAVAELRRRGFVAADHSPYIRLCPAYTMSADTQTWFIEAIRSVI